MTRAVAIIIGSVFAMCVAAQDVPPPERDPANPPAKEQAAPPTLDELLGLEDGDESREEDRDLPLGDPTENELQRRLEGKQINEAFVQAVTLMGETAQRIDAGRDTGITTQRLQEEILRKLDQVLESAQQSQSSSSSSEQPQQQPDQRQQQNQSQQQSDSQDPEDAPPEQSGQLLPQGAGNSASWGSLRAHVRDALQQGTSDPFSSLYRSLTEDFYKRLAEEDGR